MATPSPTQLPLNISIAPFPQGFQGDMDETFQQACVLMEAYIEGNFLSGLILPPGSTLPTSDQGPIAMGGVWYFWDPVSGQYLPQTVSVKPATNYCKNATYQVRQTGDSFNLSSPGAIKTYDMAVSRVTQGNILTLAVDVGPPAGGDNDFIGNAAKYTVGTTLVTSPAATDLFVHEHLIEGSDLNAIQGEVLSLAFSALFTAPGTYSGYLTNGGRDASYVFNFTITTTGWNRIKVNGIPPLATGIGSGWNFSEGQTGLYLGVVMAVGAQYQTATPNQWISGFFAGTASNSNMLGVTNNQFKVTAIKLEANASCTYFTANSFERDFHDAIRYFWTSFTYQSSSAGVFAFTLVSHVAGNSTGVLMFGRRMAKVPIVTINAATSLTAGAVRNLSTNADVAITPSAQAKGMAFSGVTTGSAKGDLLVAYVTADARLS